jgi:hypothetical protein
MSSDVARNLNDLLPFEMYPYASYLQGRTNGGTNYEGSADFKRHKTLGHAKSATGAVSRRAGYPGSKIYTWIGVYGDDGHWEELTTP